MGGGSGGRGKGMPRAMAPVEEVDVAAVRYKPAELQAPHLTGFPLRAFVWLLESPLLGPLVTSILKKQNNMTQVRPSLPPKFSFFTRRFRRAHRGFRSCSGAEQMLQHTVIPERPMFYPEYPPQEPERGVVTLGDDRDPVDRVEEALSCLAPYDPSGRFTSADEKNPFLYWKIRDFAYAYRSGITTPSAVAELVIAGVEEWNNKKPPMPMLIFFKADDLRKQADASTKRFEKGSPISVLDGIFFAVKDDIDCLPYPSKSATTFFDEIRPVEKDAVAVSRLRKCGVIFIGKANMHELGLGVTGNNPNYGTVRNPHSVDRYTGGSSSGPAALVSSGLCSGAIGTDGGGSVRIPSSLCGIVGLKTTFGRTDMTGVVCDAGTVEVASPLTSSVEDSVLLYSALAGSRPMDKLTLRPSLLCVPNLVSSENSKILQSVKVGKYTEWFHDVPDNEVSNTCEDALNLLCSTFGCQIEEIILPELEEMRTAHLVSIGSEAFSDMNAHYQAGRRTEMTLDTRASLALFKSFTSADYVAAQCLRRRIMYYHMEAFKKVDVIATPTTGMTAPKIPPSALKGESDYVVSAKLMQFIFAGNLLGLPAISVPVGHDKQGLPIGLQLIGRPWGEASLLRVASAVEELCLKRRSRPSTFYDILKT
ncbi:fatty acid amide hydrolase isoform X1 [Triticum aestivum]|uniref:fatty acid amide hydrolase isoform X1 n=1 Tax=Triticum aestivum TaxID=4565 RepID=UPI001D0073F4|nr:fatty acid amide hydrolase-like isoform X1 [Triticum aestivum]